MGSPSPPPPPRSLEPLGHPFDELARAFADLGELHRESAGILTPPPDDLPLGPHRRADQRQEQLHLNRGFFLQGNFRQQEGSPRAQVLGMIMTLYKKS